MGGWLKSYLLEKSVEALRELGTESEDDRPLSAKSNWPRGEQRKYERVSAQFPMVYQVRKETITGTTVNVCNEGMMVESYLSPRRVLEVFDILSDREKQPLEIKCIHEGKTYLLHGEVRHFQLSCSGGGSCRLKVGFWIPLIED